MEPIDANQFKERALRIFSNWEKDEGGRWKKAKFACVVLGTVNPDEVLYSKASALHTYLFSVELPDTLIALVAASTEVVIVSSAKKVSKYLQPLVAACDGTPLRLTLIPRKPGADDEAFSGLLDRFKQSEGKAVVGALGSEDTHQAGTFAKAWLARLADCAWVEAVNVASGLADALAVKDAAEQTLVKKSAQATQSVMRKFVRRMKDVVNEEQEAKHSELAQMLEDNFAKLEVDAALPPVVQSGAKLDFGNNVESDDGKLTYNVIYCSLTARYNSYCAWLARTYFIDPPKHIQQAYKLLLDAQQAAIDALTDGTTAARVYNAVKETVQQRDAALVPHLSSSAGHSVGIEVREAFSLKESNKLRIKAGMVFAVTVHFKDIPVPQPPTSFPLPSVSMRLSDTVLVGPRGAVMLTDAPKAWNEVMFFIDEGEEDGEADGPDDAADVAAEAAALTADMGAMRSTRLRDRGMDDDALAAEARRQERQAQLIKRKAEEARRRMKAAENGEDEFGAGDGSAPEIKAFPSAAEYPKDALNKQVLVDTDREVVFLPINNLPVPFHISTIKSVSKADEERATFLRINFHAPGASIPRDVPPAMAAVCATDTRSVFVKTLAFRSRDSRNLTTQYRLLKELQKRVRARMRRQAEEEDLVEQDELQLNKKTTPTPRLSDLSMRPPISGRKTQGTLEAHVNGFRYRSTKGETLDVLYNNIKHGIFQPCENELIVLLHLHLRNPIMVGKKKRKDVQFFTEVVEASQNIDDRRRSTFDPDEVEEEQRERVLRTKLNNLFQDFVHKVETQVEKRGKTTLEFDIPYRNMGFFGTPNKEMVFVQPARDCLVNLTEQPFFVVSLDEVEHVHFERVTFREKHCDLVIVFKDYNREVVRISAVPVEHLTTIMEWLNEVELTYTTGTATFNWKQTMAAVRDDDRFWLATDEDGRKKPMGWQFLQAGDGDSDDESGEDSASNFSEELGSDDLEEAEEEEEEEEEYADEDEEEGDYEDEDEEEEDDEEEGASWEALERKAAEDDRKRKREEDNDDRARGKTAGKKSRR